MNRRDVLAAATLAAATGVLASTRAPAAARAGGRDRLILYSGASFSARRFADAFPDADSLAIDREPYSAWLTGVSPRLRGLELILGVTDPASADILRDAAREKGWRQDMLRLRVVADGAVCFCRSLPRVRATCGESKWVQHEARALGGAPVEAPAVGRGREPWATLAMFRLVPTHRS